MENTEFRDLLLYSIAGRTPNEDKAIPHCTKMQEIITTRYREVHNANIKSFFNVSIPYS